MLPFCYIPYYRIQDAYRGVEKGISVANIVFVGFGDGSIPSFPLSDAFNFDETGWNVIH